MKNDELSYNLGDTVDRLISVQYFMSGGGSGGWCVAEDLVSRWAKSIIDSEKNSSRSKVMAKITAISFLRTA